MSGIAASGHLGIREEASFGSGGTITDYLPIISEDIQLGKSYSYKERIMVTPQQAGGRFQQEFVAGSITFPVCPQTPASVWRCAIGGAASPYAPARPAKSFAMELNRDTGVVYASGDVVGSVELSSEQGGELVATMQIEGKGYKRETNPTIASYVSGDDPYLHSEAVFTINGTTINDITAFNVSIDHNLITGLYANQRQRRVIPATKVGVSGSITKLFQDVNELTTFLAETVVSIQAAYSRGARSLTILVNKAHFDAHNSGMGGQAEYIMETIPFTGYVDDPSTEKVVKITIV